MSQEIEEPGKRVTRGKLRRLSAERELTQAPGTPKKVVNRRVSQLDSIEETGQSPDIDLENDPLEKLKTRSTTASPSRSTRSKRAGSVSSDTTAVNKNVAKLKETQEKTPKRTRKVSSLTEENVSLLEEEVVEVVEVTKSVGRVTRRRPSTDSPVVATPSSAPVRRSTRRNSATSDDASIKSAPPVTPNVPKRTTRRSMAAMAIPEDENENSNSKNSSFSEVFDKDEKTNENDNNSSKGSVGEKSLELQLDEKNNDNMKNSPQSSPSVAENSLEITDETQVIKLNGGASTADKESLKDENDEVQTVQQINVIENNASAVIDKTMEEPVQQKDTDAKIIAVPEKSIEIKVQLGDTNKDEKIKEKDEKTINDTALVAEKLTELKVPQQVNVAKNSPVHEKSMELKVQLEDFNKDGKMIENDEKTINEKALVAEKLTELKAQEQEKDSKSSSEMHEKSVELKVQMNDINKDGKMKENDEKAINDTYSAAEKSTEIDVSENEINEKIECNDRTASPSQVAAGQSMELKVQLQDINKEGMKENDMFDIKETPPSKHEMSKNVTFDGNEKGDSSSNYPKTPKSSIKTRKMAKDSSAEDIFEISEEKADDSLENIVKDVQDSLGKDTSVCIFDTPKVDKRSQLKKLQEKSVASSTPMPKKIELLDVEEKQLVENLPVSSPKADILSVTVEPKKMSTTDVTEKDEQKFSKSWSQTVKKSNIEGEAIDSFGVKEKIEAEKATEDGSKIDLSLSKSKDSIITEDDQEEDDDEDKNSFIDDEAIEVPEDYHSGDSMDSEERKCLEDNEIPIDSISLGSEDGEEGEEEEYDSDMDSFIASDEPSIELMSSDDAVEKKEKKVDLKKKRKRIKKLASSSDEEIEDKAKVLLSVEKSDQFEQIDLVTEESDDNVVKKFSNKSHVTITSTDGESSVLDESKILENIEKLENAEDGPIVVTDSQSTVDEVFEKNAVVVVANEEKSIEKSDNDENDTNSKKELAETLPKQEITDKSQEKCKSTEEQQKVSEDNVPELKTREKPVDETTEDKIASDHVEIKDSSLETSVDSNSNKKSNKKKFDMSQNWIEEDIVATDIDKSRKSLPAVLHDITAVSTGKNKRKTIATTAEEKTIVAPKDKTKSKRKSAMVEKDDEKSPPKKKKADESTVLAQKKVQKIKPNIEEITFDNDKLLAKCNEFIRQKKEKKRENRSVHKKKKEEKKLLKLQQKKEEGISATTEEESPDNKKKKKRKIRKPNFLLSETDDDKPDSLMKALEHKKRIIELKRLRQKERKDLKKLLKAEDLDGDKKKKKKKKEASVEVKENKTESEIAAPERKKALISAYSILKANTGENGSDFGVVKKKKMQLKETVSVKNEKKIEMQVAISKKKKNDVKVIEKPVMKKSKLALAVEEVQHVLEENNPSKKAKKAKLPATDDTSSKSRKSKSLPAFDEVEMTPPKKTKLKVLGKMVSGFFEEPVTPKELRLKKNRGFVEEQATPPPPKGFKVKDIFPAEQEYFKSKEVVERKRKIVIEEPRKGLPGPVWTASGMFAVEDLPADARKKRRGDYIPLSGAGTSTDFVVKSLVNKKSNKLRIDENICSKNVQNFKKIAIMEKNAHLREAGKRK